MDVLSSRKSQKKSRFFEAPARKFYGRNSATSNSGKKHLGYRMTGQSSAQISSWVLVAVDRQGAQCFIGKSIFGSCFLSQFLFLPSTTPPRTGHDLPQALTICFFDSFAVLIFLKIPDQFLTPTSLAFVLQSWTQKVTRMFVKHTKAQCTEKMCVMILETRERALGVHVWDQKPHTGPATHI